MSRHHAQIAVVHIQELGGKEFEQCMQHVGEFIALGRHIVLSVLMHGRRVGRKAAEQGYGRVVHNLDQDFHSDATFTVCNTNVPNTLTGLQALGSIIFIHDSFQGDLKIWNFFSALLNIFRCFCHVEQTACLRGCRARRRTSCPHTTSCGRNSISACFPKWRCVVDAS